MELEDPRPYVAPAAKALDQLWPGWEHHVDVEALNMYSCSSCVLGQLGSALTGKPFVFGAMHGHVMMFIQANQLWPYDIDGVFSSNIVREAWIREIKARRTPWQQELETNEEVFA